MLGEAGCSPLRGVSILNELERVRGTSVGVMAVQRYRVFVKSYL